MVQSELVLLFLYKGGLVNLPIVVHGDEMMQVLKFGLSE